MDSKPPTLTRSEWWEYERHRHWEAWRYTKTHPVAAVGGLVIGVAGLIGLVIWMAFSAASPPDDVRPTLYWGGVSLAFVVGTYVVGLVLAPARLAKLAAATAAAEVAGATARADAAELAAAKIRQQEKLFGDLANIRARAEALAEKLPSWGKGHIPVHETRTYACVHETFNAILDDLRDTLRTTVWSHMVVPEPKGIPVPMGLRHANFLTGAVVPFINSIIDRLDD